MKTSLIITILNEAATIHELLQSIAQQIYVPDEVIITDGGSTDRTLDILAQNIVQFKQLQIPLRIITKKGNRSVGRNAAIQQAAGDIILCTDAGCILDKHWVLEMIKPFDKQATDVVAGYYNGQAKTKFEKCLLPYVLVMEDHIHPDTFLPASRSMAFRKAIWEKAGRFDEKLSHNEDYAFAKKLRNINASIVFQKTAIVHWKPRSTFREAYTMFRRFAYGDAEAGIYRPKVVLIFVRYFTGILLLFTALLLKSYVIFSVLILIAVLYLIWAVFKSYRYVRNYAAFYYLPLLQLTSDVAVMHGTISGTLKQIIVGIRN